MNFELPFLPERAQKPRTSGITMMTDKGMGVMDTENFCESNINYTDFVKMAFGTSLLIPSLESKLNIYKGADIQPIFGGTLFELFAYQHKLDDYKKYLDRYGMEHVEISDVTSATGRDVKTDGIRFFSKDFIVISQSTNTHGEGHLSFDCWTKYALEDIAAGASYIIVKESEKMPLYGKDGLAAFLASPKNQVNIDLNMLIWDAPEKKDQIELIHHFGSNVNLCNISPDGILSLEAKRLGLHSSTILKLIPPPSEQEHS